MTLIDFVPSRGTPLLPMPPLVAPCPERALAPLALWGRGSPRCMLNSTLATTLASTRQGSGSTCSHWSACGCGSHWCVVGPSVVVACCALLRGHWPHVAWGKAVCLWRPITAEVKLQIVILHSADQQRNILLWSGWAPSSSGTSVRCPSPQQEK